MNQIKGIIFDYGRTIHNGELGGFLRDRDRRGIGVKQVTLNQMRRESARSFEIAQYLIGLP